MEQTSQPTVGNKERVAIGSLLGIAFLLGVYSTISLSRQSTASIPKTVYQQQPISDTQVSGGATVVLSTKNADIGMGETVEVMITLDTGNISAEASDIMLHYDPSHLQPVDINTGTFFSSYPRQDMSTPGTIVISGIVDIKNNKLMIPKGNAPFATITFITKLSTPETSLSIDTDKTIVASSGKNIFGTADPITITITDR